MELKDFTRRELERFFHIAWGFAHADLKGKYRFQDLISIIEQHNYDAETVKKALTTGVKPDAGSLTKSLRQQGLRSLPLRESGRVRRYGYSHELQDL